MHYRSFLYLAAIVAGSAPVSVQAADVNSEITNAAMHAGLAAQANDIAGVHTHLHHTVNCLVGPGGAGFDSKEMNPCANAGNGAIPDSSNASNKQMLQSALQKANGGLASNDLATSQKDASDAAATLKMIK